MRYFPNQRHRGLEEKRRIQADDAERKRNGRKQNLIRRKRWKDQTGHEHEERRETQSMADEAGPLVAVTRHRGRSRARQTETMAMGRKTGSRCIGAGILGRCPFLRGRRRGNENCESGEGARPQPSGSPVSVNTRAPQPSSRSFQGRGRGGNTYVSNGELDRGATLRDWPEVSRTSPILSLDKECVLKL